MRSSTSTPRLHWIPARFTQSTLGRMPVETTTRSASKLRPSARARPVTASVAAQLGDRGAQERLDALLADHLGEEARGGFVELPRHEAGQELEDLHGGPALPEPVGGLEAEHAASDHGGARPRPRAREDPLHVLERAQEEHAGQPLAEEGRRRGGAPVREDAGVVRQLASFGQERRLVEGIEADDPRRGENLDLMLLVPRGSVVEQLLPLDLLRDEAGEVRDGCRRNEARR